MSIGVDGVGLIELMVSDIDGTLVTPDKQLTERTLEAVRQLHAVGVAFAITSSRPPAGLTHFIEPLGLTTPLVGFNGGMVVDRAGKVLRQFSMAPDAAQEAIAALARHGIDIWVFNGNDWLITDPNGAYVPLEHDTIRYDPIVVGDFAASLDGVTKIVGSSADPERLRAAKAELSQSLDGRATVVMSQTYYLDITDVRAHKGTAVLALSEILLIPPRHIATIGDMENDVRMFEVAGFSIAMGNATQEVQAKATVVTLANTEDGFASAVDRFILPQAPKARVSI